MPKTKLGNRTPPHAKLGMLLNGACTFAGLNAIAVGKIIGRCEDTALDRLRHPGDLTVDELMKLGKAADIPIDDLRAALQY